MNDIGFRNMMLSFLYRMTIHCCVGIVLALMFSAHSARASASDTTWIEGTISSVTKKPLAIAHVMMYLPEGVKPLTMAAADSAGRFRIGTTQLGQLRLRFTGASHAPLDRMVLSSGGHTIRVDATLATLFTPTTVWEGISVLGAGDAEGGTGETPLMTKKKGIYSGIVMQFDSARLQGGSGRYEYRLVSTIRGSSARIVSNAPDSTFGEPDGNGAYASRSWSKSGRTDFVVNTSKWPKSNLPASINFLTIDDATIDTLIQTMLPPRKNCSYERYALRSPRVREVAALACNLGWDTLKVVVPATTPAWTLGMQPFFEMLMQSTSDRSKQEYIDSLIKRNVVRNHVPTFQIAAIGYGLHMGDTNRANRLLIDMMREFPNDMRTREVRRAADPNRAVQLGKPLPQFRWQTLAGVSGTPPAATIANTDLQGVHTLIVVWEAQHRNDQVFDELERLSNTYSGQGFRIISVFADVEPGSVPPSTVARWSSGYPWPVVFSNGAPSAAATMLDQTAPYMLLIGPDQRTIAHIRGLNVTEAEKLISARLK